MTRRDPRRALHVGRFERRIVFAIAIAGFVPFVAAIVLGLVWVYDLYRVGVNDRIGGELARTTELYGAHIDLLRTHAETLADLVARDARTDALASDRAGLARHLAALGAEHPGALSAIVVEGENGAELARWSAAEGTGEVRRLTLERTTPAGRRVVVTAVARSELFPAYERAVDLASAYRVLDRAGPWVVGLTMGLYGLLLLFVIAVAVAVAILLSRRVTRRITLLAEASDRVGAGDLSAEVPTDERDEVGELTRAFNAMVRDLRESRDRVEYLERVGAWQEMARRLAHEIKNPLTPIQLAVQQVHQAYRGEDPRFRKTLDDAREIVDEEVATLRRLVSEFSEFARLPEPVLAPLDLGAFAREAVRTLDPSAMRRAGAQGPPPALEIALPEAPVPVRGDAQLLRRCLDNLVRNAVQAIDEHGGSTVIVAARVAQDDAVLEVRDDGPGVAPEARERVFQPYFTTKDFGTGLGLAIVKKAILEHGGSIECVAAPEGGASFRIRLPLAAAS